MTVEGYATPTGALLSVTGGVAGIVLAIAGVRTLVALIPGELPRLTAIGVDTRVLGFAFLISVAVGVALVVAVAIAMFALR